MFRLALASPVSKRDNQRPDAMEVASSVPGFERAADGAIQGNTGVPTGRSADGCVSPCRAIPEMGQRPTAACCRSRNHPACDRSKIADVM
jgi:hypothetical protein